MVTITTVSISDLKANLSRYIREVRRGGKVQVLYRGEPVARLVPVTASDDERLSRSRALPGAGAAGSDGGPLECISTEILLAPCIRQHGVESGRGRNPTLRISGRAS